MYEISIIPSRNVKWKKSLLITGMCFKLMSRLMKLKILAPLDIRREGSASMISIQCPREFSASNTSAAEYTGVTVQQEAKIEGEKISMQKRRKKKNKFRFLDH